MAKLIHIDIGKPAEGAPLGVNYDRRLSAE
jgi:hypothetical protein